MLTAGTYLKRPYFQGAERLRYLCETLLGVAKEHQWELQAWAVFPNHYHFVGVSPAPASMVKDSGDTGQRQKYPTDRDKGIVKFIKHLHSVTAIQANRWDQTPGRKTWFQYWDTELTFQNAYLARLGYVHKNAVHHGLAMEPSLYPWCSAGWFQLKSDAAFFKTVMGMKVDRVQVMDDFNVDPSEV